MSSGAIDEFGVAGDYRDGLGKRHTITAAARQRIHAAMGLEKPQPALAVKIIRAGKSEKISGPATLRFEDGTEWPVEEKLPKELPPGYYDLIYRGPAKKEFLLVTPGACYLPENLQAGGWAAQLYAMRSRKSWGMGDLGDLRNFAKWSAGELKSDFVLINPICATTPVDPPQASPYFPSSRRFKDPLYLRIEEIPGAEKAGALLEKIAGEGKKLNAQRLIDRAAVFKLKMKALQIIWEQSAPQADANALGEAPNLALHEFATFCALAEIHGGDWRKWPRQFRQPKTKAVVDFAGKHRQRIRFFKWLQALLDAQLGRAADEIPLMQDLPVGFDPAGADAWAWQDLLASGMNIGAPADAINVNGQDWGLPPFVPLKLRNARYEPFRQTVRAMLRHAKGLRIDHVMGLFRLFWIPHNSTAEAGAYVHYPVDELLAIVAIESWRAKSIIVGEDLGTVEPMMRTKLETQNILSYRLLWFENDAPEKYPAQALAAVTTHDLFTLSGLWTGADLAAQKKAGIAADETGTKRILSALKKQVKLRGKATLEEVAVRVHQHLAKAPSLLITATLDDALMVQERPNMPGTVSEWANWSIALPETLENYPRRPLFKKLARILRRKSARDAGIKFAKLKS